MTAREPLNLGALDALDARATPGPWRVVLDDTEGPTTVWQACTSPVHTEEVDPYGNTVFNCCDNGGLHGEPFFRSADAEFVAAARTALPALVAEVRALRVKVGEWESFAKEWKAQAEASQADRNVAYAEVDRLRQANERLRSDLSAERVKTWNVSTVKCWTNEDGNRFVFVSDLQEALGAPVEQGVQP